MGSTDPVILLSSIVAIIFAVTVHEFSHAWMADRLGDPTARIYGRLTLNPLKHFDFFGTLALIFIGIGWGKPVPFNERNLRFPKRDSALIGLAGPLSNLFTALIFAIPLKYLEDTGFYPSTLEIEMLSGAQLIQYFPYFFVSAIFHLSVVLFALNVLPFPPFDGSKIIGVFIPHRFHYAYDRYLERGINYVILFILFDMFFMKEPILNKVVGSISTWTIALISQVT